MNIYKYNFTNEQKNETKRTPPHAFRSTKLPRIYDGLRRRKCGNVTHRIDILQQLLIECFIFFINNFSMTPSLMTTRYNGVTE